MAGVRLGRLAVAKAHQRQGLGSLLVGVAIETFLEIFDKAGGISLFVDAKNERAMRYYQRFGFESLPSGALALFLSGRLLTYLFDGRAIGICIVALWHAPCF